MTVELITGFAGTPHIGSDDIGAFQAGLVGPATTRSRPVISSRPP